MYLVFTLKYFSPSSLRDFAFFVYFERCVASFFFVKFVHTLLFLFPEDTSIDSKTAIQFPKQTKTNS